MVASKSVYSHVRLCLCVKYCARILRTSQLEVCYHLQVRMGELSARNFDASDATYSAWLTIRAVLLLVVKRLSAVVAYEYSQFNKWNTVVTYKYEWVWKHPLAWCITETCPSYVYIGCKHCVQCHRKFTMTCKSENKRGSTPNVYVTDSTWCRLLDHSGCSVEQCGLLNMDSDLAWPIICVMIEWIGAVGSAFSTKFCVPDVEGICFRDFFCVGLIHVSAQWTCGSFDVNSEDKPRNIFS